MMKTEYTVNGGFLQRDSVEHEKYTKNSFYLNESSRRDFLPPLTPPYVPFGIRRFSSQSHIISTLLLILI